MNDLAPSIDVSTLVTLVDAADQVVGTADRVAAHRGEGMLHRAASVFLLRHGLAGQIEVLLQQRSSVKIVAANLWANTACGNCQPGELPLACIERRLREEVGISGGVVQKITEFVYQVACEPGWSESEYDHLFAGWYDGPIALNPAEVQAVRWVNWSDLLASVQAGTSLIGSQPLAPWVPLFLQLPQVQTGLTHWLTTYD